MSDLSKPRVHLPLWGQLAAFLSLLAVFSALVMPASMLAQDVGTGKLGGTCTVDTGTSTSGDVRGSGDAGTLQAGTHCDLCGALGMALPPLHSSGIFCPPGTDVAALEVAAVLSVAVPGLPFGRGPPAL